MTKGIFQNLKDKQGFSQEQENCITDTIEKIKNANGNNDKPALLFGEIQSGKTKTFIGLIALAFDNNYDISIILTKSTKALSEQTVKRLENDFEDLIEDNKIIVFDIMALPNQLRGILNRKLIFVVKKQKDNLSRLLKLFENHTMLQEKKILIVDDEADYGTIGFKRDKTKDDGIAKNVIMSKINSLRNKTFKDYTFVQVTATPYCLYLQPEGTSIINGNEYLPNRPEITSIVPIHEKYIGGKYYFDNSEDESSPAYDLFVAVSEKELSSFNKKTKLNVVENANELVVFKSSIINYFVASAIRILQEEKNYKTSFLIHIEKAIKEHNWQFEITSKYISDIIEDFKSDTLFFNSEFKKAYEGLATSIRKTDFSLPSFESMLAKCKELLLNDDFCVLTVNSESEVINLLSKKNGQLRLFNSMNIFIGGDVLDRGITIENLIAFFYGRNPKVFQQDTVLQHSRMYGARNPKDLAVTRFYTTVRIYNAMKKMYEFDYELREAFKKGKNNDGVIFVNYDSSEKIKPCSPNKILVTETTIIKPYKRFLPKGFDIKSKNLIEKALQEIYEILSNNNIQRGVNSVANLEMVDFSHLLTLIYRTFDYSKNKEYLWNVLEVMAIAKQTSKDNHVHCIVKWNRRVSRLKHNKQRIQDAPEDGNVDLPEAKNLAINSPCLILLHQQGKKENDWNGGSEFFWPVLVTPKNTKPAIFATEMDD